MTRVAVLAGGRSPEREVSLRSGHRVVTALLARGHVAMLLDPAEGPFVENASAAMVSASYIALHGKDGEDGTVQRLLDVLAIPYTGSSPRSCQIAFDKVLAKETMDEAGVPTPPWAAIQATALRDLAAGPALHTIVGRLGLPLVVKPSRAGSAMGLSFVEHERDLPNAVMNALSYADAVVIERRILGPEVAAGLVGGVGPLPLVEVVPKSGVFDYAARYTPGATEYYAPARVDAEVTSAAQAAATAAFEVLGVRDVGRADVMIDADGAPWVVDVNVSPGMTDTSLLPMAAQAAGVGFDELCDRILRLALERPPLTR
ncbi:MAG: D-alanine--D-alanine ligase family protein [Actinomycetota bacterium]